MCYPYVYKLENKTTGERTKKIIAKLKGRKMTDNQKKNMSMAKKGKSWEEIYGIN